MPVVARLEALSTTAEVIVSLAALRASNPNKPLRVAIKNVDAAITVYIGGSDVASSGAGGYELLFGESITLDLYAGEEVYAVGASGTPSIRILEVGDKL